MIIETIKISECAELTAYLHSPSDEMQSEEAVKRPAVIVCPGGAYMFCSDREADAPAMAFLNMGLQVFVLRYSVDEFAGNKQPLTEIAASIKFVRENAQRWLLDKNKVAVCGFSAGGHLAASIGVHWNDPEIMARLHIRDAMLLRPDAMVLCYPVITAGEFAHRQSVENISRNCSESIDYWSLETQVNPQTPPAFLWHTVNDNAVPVENSFLFAQQLHKCGVPCECHFFEDGQHGMSAATREVNCASKNVHMWLQLCQNWLTGRFGPLGGSAD